MMGIKESLFTCKCGCDEPIPYSPRHEYPSRKPTYKIGHSRRSKFKLDRKTVEKEYRDMGSGFKVAEKYDVSPVAVYNMLKKIGVEMIPKEELNESAQRLGREWELECLRELKGSIDCTKDNWRNPYDIEWNGLRINVKASRPVSNGCKKGKPYWSFNTKANVNTDFFLCIGLDERMVAESIFWIPVNQSKKQTTVSRRRDGKYEKYRTTFSEINHTRQDNKY